MQPARLLLGLLFLGIALSVVAGGHLYVAQRLLIDPELPPGLVRAGVGVLAALFIGLLLAFPAERLLPHHVLRRVVWLPMLWMGVLFLTFTTLVASDGLLWLLGAAAPESGDVVGPARLRAAAVLGVVGLATAVGLREALRIPRVRRVPVELERWPRELDGYRVVQISDLHVGPMRGADFVRALVARIERLEPDLVVVTGDLVDGSVARLREEVEPFAALRGRDGVFFVTGNHDFYSGADSWVARVTELGWQPLRNRRVRMGEGRAAFELAGVDDHRGDWVRGSGEDLDAALAGRDPDLALVLLAHDPSTWKRASRRDVDLQLSGHTHGGQIWPFRYLVRLAVPFVEGLYRRGRCQLYVSRGTGFWGPPLRVFSPAEITELVLHGPVREQAS